MNLSDYTMNIPNEDISRKLSTKNKRKKRKREESDSNNDGIIENDDKSSIVSNELSYSLINDDKSSIHSTEISNSLIIDERDDQKLFRKFMVKTKKPVVRMYSIEKLLRVCCNAFAYHRLNSAAQLMPALVKNKRTPHSFIVKAAFILFTQKPSNCDLLLKSMKKFRKYDINKRQIMLEIIIYFLQNNDQIGAKKYIESNEAFLKYDRFRNNHVIDPYLKCFISFVDYLEWKQSIEESNDNIVYHSYRMISEKTKLSLKNIISETKDLVLDYFVIILVEMYEYSQQFTESFEILDIYLKNNPNHLNAYIYLYNFGVKYPDYSSQELQTKTFEYILKNSPENQIILDLVQRDEQIVNKFESLMEFVDHKHNFDDINAWTQLKHLITSIKDKDTKNSVNKLWKDIYEEYWIRLHCNVNKIKQINENEIQLIKCKQKVIEFFYFSNHSYIIQTNEKIDKYETLFE